MLKLCAFQLEFSILWKLHDLLKSVYIIKKSIKIYSWYSGIYKVKEHDYTCNMLVKWCHDAKDMKMLDFCKTYV